MHEKSPDMLSACYDAAVIIDSVVSCPDNKGLIVGQNPSVGAGLGRPAIFLKKGSGRNRTWPVYSNCETIGFVVKIGENL